MINYLKATFITSFTTKNDGKIPFLPEVIFIGRSNVGKSSLINALINRKNLAYTSKKPGLTKLLNYYNVDDTFYLVDAPGYGYAKGKKGLDNHFNTMMDDYFSNNEQLKHVFLLLDPRHEISVEDNEFLTFVKHYEIPVTIIYTKSDKLNQSEKAMALYRSQHSLKITPFFVSSLKKSNIEVLQDYIAAIISK